MITESKFLAALLTIAGPPISIFSMISSKSSVFSIVALNGYKFTQTKSIPSTPSSFAWSRWDCLSRLCKIPPWIYGFKVLTLPSKHSGNFVTSFASITAIPASFNLLYVPPVEIISYPKDTSSL